MLLLPNKKKMASIIVAGIGPKKPSFVQKLGEESDTGKYETPEGGDEADAGVEASMESFMKAMDEKNVKAAVKAFKELWSQIDDDSGSEGPEEEQEETAG